MKTKKTKSVQIRQFAIFCFSELANKYAPTLWPNQSTETEAKELARQNVRNGTKYEIRSVLITQQTAFKYPPTPTVDQRLRSLLIGQRLPFTILNAKTGAIVAPANATLRRFHVKRLIANRGKLEFPAHPLRDKITAILH